MNGSQPRIRMFSFTVVAALLCASSALAGNKNKDADNSAPGYGPEIVRVSANTRAA